jgi:WD40 repeat protein
MNTRFPIVNGIVVVLLLAACTTAHAQTSPPTPQAPKPVVQTGHTTDFITQLAFSPDGKLLATAGLIDPSVKIWDVKTGKELRSFKGSMFFGFSALHWNDASKLTAFELVHNLHEWNTTTGIPITIQTATVQGESRRPQPLGKFSKDGSKILAPVFQSQRENKIHVWDASTVRELFSLSTTSATNAMFSPDGTLIVTTGSDSCVTMWDATTGQFLRVLAKDNIQILEMEFNSSGTVLATSSTDNTVKLWDVRTGTVLHTLQGLRLSTHSTMDASRIGGMISPSLAFSPDGKRLATSSDSTVLVWDVATGMKIKTFEPFRSTIATMTFSPDGRVIALTTTPSGRKIYVINAETGERIHELQGKGSVANSARFHPHGRAIVSSHFPGFSQKSVREKQTQHSIRLWNLQDGTSKTVKRQMQTGSLEYTTFNKSSVILREESDTLCILSDIETGRIIQRIKKDSSNQRISFSDDGKLVVLSSGGSTIINLRQSFGDQVTVVHSNKILDVSTGKELYHIADTMKSSVNIATGVEFSPNNQVLSIDHTFVIKNSTGKDSIVTATLFYHARTGQKIAEIAGDANFFSDSLVFRRGNYIGNSSILSIDSVFNIFNGKKEKPVLPYFDSTVVVGFFSPEIVCFRKANGDTVGYHIPSKKFIHLNFFIRRSISSDGKYAFQYAQFDTQFTLYDAQTARELATLYALDSTDWVITTPDGRFDASEGGMKSLHFVQGVEPIPLESLMEKFYTPNLLPRALAGEFVGDTTTALALKKALETPRPDIRILDRRTGESFTQETIPLTVQVSSPNGISEVRVFNNGKRVAGEKARGGAFPMLFKTYQIPLVAGANVLSVSALDADRTESLPTMLTLTRNAPKQSSTLYVVAMGVNQYKDKTMNLNYSVADAKDFLDTLSRTAQGIFDRIETTLLLDGQVTKAGVTRVLDSLSRKTTEADALVLFYAGHGVSANTGAGGSTTGKFAGGSAQEFFLMLHDVPSNLNLPSKQLSAVLGTKALSSQELTDYSTRIRAQKQLFVIDACYAGSLLKASAPNACSFRPEENKTLKLLARSAGVNIFAASSEQETAKESSSLKHGLFTFALLQGLAGKADIRGKKKIDVLGLQVYLDDEVPTLAERLLLCKQQPLFWCPPGKNFVLGAVK